MKNVIKDIQNGKKYDGEDLKTVILTIINANEIRNKINNYDEKYNKILSELNNLKDENKLLNNNTEKLDEKNMK